ncbi:MAG: 16S rRNA (cytosine(967)-C(5))-methyltransferase RsmB [Rhodothermales bacterium]|nr:16S rRNA (cytosine(967)-C(5))-methyltransferase RsmB [Rhodothermales bacterium]
MSATNRNEDGGSYRLAAARELDRVEKDDAFVGFARRGRGGDPAFERSVTDVVAGVTRLRRRLDFLIDSLYRGDPDGLESGVRTVLRIGLYELLNTRTPAHAAINEAVETVRVYVHPRVTGLVNGILRSASRRMDDLPTPDTGDRVRDLGLLYSHPDWIVRRWIERYGEEAAVRLMEHDNRRPRHGVHVRGDGTAVLDALRSEGVAWEESPLVADFIRVDSVQPLVRSGLLRRGDVRIQDEAAAMVVRVLDPQDGERILDLCAAPGGKTLLAAETAPRARVTAADLHAGRLDLVRTSAERAKLENVDLRVMDARTPDEELTGVFDRVLVDAPCSGLGVLSRRADLRWRRSEEDIADLVALQDAIIDGAARCVAPGGLLVYATCTLEPEENERRVEAFLDRNDGFVRESCAPFIPDRLVDAEGDYLSLPFETGMDGAYAARLRRRVDAAES